MSFLNTTGKVVHSSRLPPGTTRAQAVAMLSDHEFFLTCDPHLVKSELMSPADVAKLNPPPSIPDHIKSKLRSQPPSPSLSPSPPPPLQQEQQEQQPTSESGKQAPTTKEEQAAPQPTCYRVTDIVHAIPAGIWDTTVVSDFELTRIADGLFVRIRSPLGVVMETVWEIREPGGEGVGLELVEDVTIRCSRLLVGLVKSQCEDSWTKIHGRMIARLEGELRE